MEATAAQEILAEIRRRLSYFYLKLKIDAELRGSKGRILPPLSYVSETLDHASFRIFPDPEGYATSDRASRARDPLPGPRSTMGSDVFRIFFNDFSKKIYIDLNRPRWVETGDRLGLEQLYCELLKAFVLLSTRETPNRGRKAPSIDRSYLERCGEDPEEIPLVEYDELLTRTTIVAQEDDDEEEIDCPRIDTKVK